MGHVQSLITCLSEQVCTSINPDHAIAVGAATLSAILSGCGGELFKDMLMLDVQPLSLGVALAGDGEPTAFIVERNTTLPTVKTQTFTTAEDGQAGATLRVCEGEGSNAASNLQVGTVHLHGIPHMPRGVPEIKVTFRIDTNGVLDVEMLEKRSGRRLKTSVGYGADFSLHDTEIQALAARHHALPVIIPVSARARLSVASTSALAALDGIRADLALLRSRLDGAKAQVHSPPPGLRGALAIMHGSTRRLIDHGVDTITTYALESGRVQAKEEKRTLTQQAQALVLEVEEAIAAVDAAGQPVLVEAVALVENIPIDGAEQLVSVQAVAIAEGEGPLVEGFALVDLPAVQRVVVAVA